MNDGEFINYFNCILPVFHSFVKYKQGYSKTDNNDNNNNNNKNNKKNNNNNNYSNNNNNNY